MRISDPLYGFIELGKVQQALLEECSELQRLNHIMQLGLGYVAFPGARHTRFTHDLGVSHLCRMIATQLELTETEKTIVEVAGLLHDVGHTPFSHALEGFLKVDHMDLTRDIVTGKHVMNLPNAGNIPKVLKKFGIDAETVGDLIAQTYQGARYLQQVVFGGIDADQLDFLQRDAYFAGVKLGTIDLQYIVNSMGVKDGVICFKEKATESLIHMLIARHVMFTSVYKHHAKRVAEAMLVKAMALGGSAIRDFSSMTDGELLTKLREQEGKTKELVDNIIFRKLYKVAYEISTRALTDDNKKLVKRLRRVGWANMEKMILERVKKAKTDVKLEKGDVLVDMPHVELERSEPRLKIAEIPILRDDGSLVSLGDLSPIPRMLAQEESTEALFAVYCPEAAKALVAEATEQALQEI